MESCSTTSRYVTKSPFITRKESLTQYEFLLQNIHAASQNPDKKEEDFQYKCLWTGCKVFGRASSSKSWLEKHVAGHVEGGQKPFQVQQNDNSV